MGLEHVDISRMLETAVVAARLAGRCAMEKAKYVKYSAKSEDEIVTDADFLCQQLIIDRIKDNYPDHGFIAEEGTGGAMFRQPPRMAEPIWWLIDPIDGTNNYAHGLLCFCVSIAAVYEGVPVVGVIFNPATDSMFTAAKDADAQLNTSRITASDSEINRLDSFAIDSHFEPELTGAVAEIMKRTRFRNLGSTALHMTYVAKGALIGMAATRAKLWDIAAGAIIVESAGGAFTDIHGNNVFPADLENYTGQQCTTLATNKKTHSEFLKIFNP